MFPHVMGEFCEGNQVYPVILVVVAEYPQELFDLLINPFCFSVRLGMISRAKGRSNSQSFP